MKMLEETLEKAKRGEIVSCSLVYVDIAGSPAVSMCAMSIHSPDRIIGLLERLKFTILSTNEVEATEEVDPYGS